MGTSLFIEYQEDCFYPSAVFLIVRNFKAIDFYDLSDTCIFGQLLSINLLFVDKKKEAHLRAAPKTIVWFYWKDCECGVNMGIIKQADNLGTQLNGSINTATSMTPKKKDTANDPKENLW